jgi:hypothetical protein
MTTNGNDIEEKKKKVSQKSKREEKYEKMRTGRHNMPY